MSEHDDLMLIEMRSVREAIDKLRDDFADHRVRIEGRLTKVEQRASFYGAVLGAVTGFFANSFWPHRG